MEKIFTTLFFLIFIINCLSAQDIATDSKNKGIFTYYPTKKYRTEFSSKDFSLTYSTAPKDIKYVLSRDTTIVNVKKQSNFYYQGSILNATDLISSSNLAGFRPGGRIRGGYQRAVDSIRVDFDRFAKSVGANIFFSVDNIKLYNTDIDTTQKRYPATIGLELNYTQFFPKRFKWMVVSLTASISKGWNDNSLLSYKDLTSGATLNSKVVAFEKTDGKYGVLKTGLNKARISASIPMTFWYLNIIPYAVWTKTAGDPPSYFIGVYTNVLSERLDFYLFRLPSTFGLGVDLIKNGEKWSSPNIFIRGSFNIGKY